MRRALLRLALLSAVFAAAPPAHANHTVTTVVVPNLCNGSCAASATATVSGGSGSFAYQWSTVPVQTTATALGLCAGTYLVIVTDLVNGDQVPAFAIVVDPPPLAVFFSNTSPLCNGQCDGSSSASVSGGSPPYAYAWTGLPGVPGPQATNLCAGAYALTVTDANGCTITRQTTLGQPAALLPNGSAADATAPLACDGSASVAPSGGTGPYGVSWSPGGASTPALPALCPGAYTASVTDAHGCTALYRAKVAAPGVVPALGFRPLSPCRLADTRRPPGPYGAPPVGAGATRLFDVVAAACGVPASARAVALNVTVVSPAAGGELAVTSADAAGSSTTTLAFPAGRTRAGSVVAGVSASPYGTIAVTSTAAAPVDVVLDVSGFFE